MFKSTNNGHSDVSTVTATRNSIQEKAYPVRFSQLILFIKIKIEVHELLPRVEKGAHELLEGHELVIIGKLKGLVLREVEDLSPN